VGAEFHPLDHYDVSLKSFVVGIVDDALAEPPETLDVVLSKPAGGAVLGSQATAVVFISSDE